MASPSAFACEHVRQEKPYPTDCDATPKKAFAVTNIR
jgi:hypothetical protein